MNGHRVLEKAEEFFMEVMDYYREQSNVWKREQGQWKLQYIVQ